MVAPADLSPSVATNSPAERADYPQIGAEMKRMLSLAILVGGMTVGVAGCSKESSTTTETEVSGPGGTTTVTEETTVETTGENPPPAN
jgi:hypothetical protein